MDLPNSKKSDFCKTVVRNYEDEIRESLILNKADTIIWV